MRTLHLLRLVFVALALGASSANAVVTLSASPTGSSPGAVETGTWAGIVSPSTSNWIGVYVPGAAHTAYKAWSYTNGSASGSLNLTLPGNLAVGTYELRLFQSSYTHLVTSNTFFVGRTVSGTVTLSGSPLAGVASAATNGGLCGVSNGSGQYTCTVPNGWSGSITPSLLGYSFTPGSRSYTNVTANQTAQTYTATLAYQVNGTVTDGASPVAGVAFAATNGAVCTSSNGSGQYSCNVTSGWSGSVTPSLANHAFTPVSRSYTNVTGIQSGENYTVVPVFQVSGTVSLNGIPLPNVAMGATNGVTCSPTNASGQYSCAAPAGWSGSVTPSQTGYTFTPASRNYSSLPGDQAAQTYAAVVAGGADPIYFIHVDHLNTPRAVFDASQQLRWKWEQQEPFAVNAPDENPSSLGAFEFALRFPGQYFDKETNLHYNSFRDFDPGLGTYKQSDPIGLRGGRNTYTYVYGSPLRYRDKYGLQAIPIPVLPVGVGGSAHGKRRNPSGWGEELFPPANRNPSISWPGWLQLPSIWSNEADDEVKQCPVPVPDSPTTPPGDDWEWRGKLPVGGDKGAWFNPDTGESMHPDLDHPYPIGPHWDYTDRFGKGWRVDPGSGMMRPK